jgi:hypothetical protein
MKKKILFFILLIMIITAGFFLAKYFLRSFDLKSENQQASLKPAARPVIKFGTYEFWDKECQGRQDYACCRESLDIMTKNNYQHIPMTGCPVGFKRNQLKCKNTFVWCEPGKEAIK